MKYQWEVWLESRQAWLSFYHSFESESAAMEFKNLKSMAMRMSHEYRFRLVEVH